MLGRWMVAIALAMGVSSAAAQDVGGENLPGATRVVRTPELPVEGDGSCRGGAGESTGA